MEKLLNVKEMNLAKNGWKTIIATAFAAVSLLCGQSGSTIVLGPIEGELAKKQIALDFEGTQKNLLPLASRAINAHGAFRLANSKSSRYGIAILSKGDRQVELSIYSGKPRKVVQRILQDGKNAKDAVLTALDKMVASISGQPGFFNGRLTYLSSLSGKKEIFLSDALMSTASPQTAFGKITFNPSWDNTGTGIFFTSNRKIFNNIYHLNLASRKIRTIANYRGSNLRAVQNPRTSQVALILSASGNPEVWIAQNMESKPKKSPIIAVTNQVHAGLRTEEGSLLHQIAAEGLSSMKSHYPLAGFQEFLLILAPTAPRHRGIQKILHGSHSLPLWEEDSRSANTVLLHEKPKF